MTELIGSGLTVQVGDACLLQEASLTLQSGELLAVLGPNGAGKTTLLRSLLALQSVNAGSVSLDGRPMADMSAADRAQRVAYLPQRRPLAWPNLVIDIVALGRFAHGAAPGRLDKRDQKAVERAIDLCDLRALSSRRVDTLSGGELARVHFARALAARAALLLADEPVDALDPRHQLKIAALLRDFVDDGGGALVVLHNVALAARIADRLIWMKDGRIVADGSVTDTLTADHLRDVYDVVARVSRDESGFDVRIESAL